MHESDWDTSTAAIFHRIRELRESEIPAVLATITSVHGSSYRRPGAKMLITADGTDIGSVSAGCLEDQILALATDVIAKDAPRIETFDLMEDDDIWGLGIGCNGIIDVLLEPVDDVHADVSRALLEDQIVLTATLFKQDGPSSRVQVGIAEDAIQPAVDAPEWVEYVREMGEVALNSGQSMTRVISMENSERSVFFDVIRPPPTLLVLGSGNDVSPVVDLGSNSGFQTVVAGFRGASVAPDKFPRAHKVLTTNPISIGEAIEITPDTYTVVMSHNFVDDQLALAALLDSPTPYIGLMGPRERYEELAEALADEGRSIGPEDEARIYAPVGLDLGGGTPYQIALSIVGEVLAVNNDQSGSHLAVRDGPIHARPPGT